MTLESVTSVGQLSFFSPAECMFVFGTKWNWFDRRDWCRELPGSLYPVSETLPGKEALVHISARNQAEREAVALVFSVPGSWIGLLFMEGSCSLAKGQLVLHPVLTPFCLPPSVTWSVTPAGWLHPSGKMLWEKQEGRSRKLNTDHGWIFIGVQEGGKSMRWAVLSVFPVICSGQVF